MNKALDTKKLLNIIKGFPDEARTIEQYKEGNYLKRGIQLCIEYGTWEAIITLTVFDMGIIRKHTSYTNKETKFSCSIYVPENVFIFSRYFIKKESDILCERLLPFMLSRGKNKSTIPLIINDFPEFANLAMRYIP